MIALLPTTTSYACTYAQCDLYTKPPLKPYDSTTTYYYVICYHICLHGLLTHPPVKRMIALLPTTMSYVGICAQHCPDTKPPLKPYDSTTTYYYVICNHICLHGLWTKPLEKNV